MRDHESSFWNHCSGWALGSHHPDSRLYYSVFCGSFPVNVVPFM
jgi:hypothetical protein